MTGDPPAGTAGALRALATARAWGLLGDLARRGVTPETLPAWRELGLLGDERLDELGVAWTELFVLDVSPYASAWLSSDGLVGGDAAAEIRAAMAASGHAPALEPDHAGALFGWLAFLAGAHADALRDGVASDAGRHYHRAVGQFVRPWMEPWVGALPAGFHRRAFELGAALAAESPALPWSLPPAAPLDDPRLSLRRIAELLVIPAQAGGWWSRRALLALGRALDLPMGFGGRADLVESLLQAAAHYGVVPAAAEALAAGIEGWRHPEPWGARGRAMAAFLREVGRHGENPPPGWGS